MALIQVVFVLITLTDNALANIYADVAEFCKNNGLNYITLSSFPYLENESIQMVSALWNNSRMVRQLSFEDIQNNYKLDIAGCIEKNVVCPLDPQLHQDSLVLMATSDQLKDEASFIPLLSMITISKVKRGLIVFTTPLTKSHKSLLRNMIDHILENSFFYIAYKDDTSFETNYMQAITIRNITKKMVDDNIQLDTNGIVIEHYDFQGIEILSMTLSWAPFFTIENCDPDGKNCDCYGFYGDFATEMGKIMNFTWDSHADPDNNWGVRPSSGPYNKSGIWGGAMGGVINGDYPMSLSQWVWIADRYNLVDFISTSSDYFLLALTPKPPEIDYGLFIRCFTDDAWTGKLPILSFF